MLTNNMVMTSVKRVRNLLLTLYQHSTLCTTETLKYKWTTRWLLFPAHTEHSIHSLCSTAKI